MDYLDSQSTIKWKQYKHEQDNLVQDYQKPRLTRLYTKQKTKQIRFGILT